MSLSQNEMGRAFEYGIAVSISEYLKAPIQDGLQVREARRCFELCAENEQRKIGQAATEATAFLVAHDNRLSEKECFVSIQSDQQGMYGDVRDIIVHNTAIGEEIGISAKHHHWAVKHSRLSESIDFGCRWFGIPCSDDYFQIVTPIFRELRSRQEKHEKWRDIPDKNQRYYMPVLQAFSDELQRLFQVNPTDVSRDLIHYLLGMYDYYKIIKENGSVSIMSFNINGTLKWGRRVPLPTRIIEIAQKPHSETTIFVTLDRGWQLSFRIHNASSMVEPSLKFDISIIGLPTTIDRHVIEYG